MVSQVIFSPIQIGDNQLKHRVVLAPLTRCRATEEAIPNDLMVEYYTQRASHGGLLITEGTFIGPLAGGYKRVPGIYRQDQIEAWKKITKAVHEKKAIIFLQLWHLGRAGAKELNPNQEQIVSASDIKISTRKIMGGPLETPRALDTKEIPVIVEQYRQAALNAMEAGFDGVEIHNANGYLLDQFVNSNSNKRTDRYGGSIENRTRFSREVLDAVVDAIGPKRTAIRFSPGGALQDMGDESVEETWGYLTSEIQRKHPELAYLHFIESQGDVMGDTINTVDSLEPYRKIWKGPFVSASGFSNATHLGIAQAERTNDLIAFGRAFIANPDLPERLRNGWELNKYDRNDYYSAGSDGYTNYSFYNM